LTIKLRGLKGLTGERLDGGQFLDNCFAAGKICGANGLLERVRKRKKGTSVVTASTHHGSSSDAWQTDGYTNDLLKQCVSEFNMR